MTRLKRVLDDTRLFLVMAVFLAAWAAAHLWPASYWMEVDMVQAGPAQARQRIPMIVERRIHREFVGRWVVSVRKFSETGWQHHCGASASAHYEPGAELPPDLDLSWWTDGHCPVLSPGRYVVHTTWVIYPGVSFMPRRSVTAVSNIFTVSL